MVHNTFSLPAINAGEPLQKLFIRGAVPEVCEQHRCRHSSAIKIPKLR